MAPEEQVPEPPGLLFVAGMNHRTAPVAVREQLALEEEKIREILADLAGRGLLQEVMILSTCNRVEVYGVAPVPGEARSQAFSRLGSHRGMGWRELEPLLYTVTGDEAALHAFRVAASLDSMILGEPQILGQVKDAFALAQSAGTAGPVLHALMSQASGENVLVELEIGGDGHNRTALVQEVQHSPVGGEIRHVDFHAVSMDQMIEAEVPLEPVGTAIGVKTFGGLLEQSLRSLAIECLPGDLPDRITVDVSQLNIGDSIHVREIQLPQGVTPKAQPDLTAFSVLAPMVEEEPVAAEAEAAADHRSHSSPAAYLILLRLPSGDSVWTGAGRGREQG